MICLRFDLRRKMVSYVYGRLSWESVRAIEVHLIDCSRCRSRLERLLRTDALIRELPRVAAGASVWKGIELAINAPRRIRKGSGRYRIWAVSAAAVVAAVFLGFLLNDQWTVLRSANHPLAAASETFQEISLAQFSNTDQPHVSTVGYVSEIQTDEEDGDLTFKLVDDIHQPKHFIVCEIIPAFKMDAPPPGSLIRVSGINRFDNEAEHQWFEIHPVLSIQQVR
jgi:hypothetical protein